MANWIREGGATDLFIGPIADGQLLKRSGVGIVGSDPASTFSLGDSSLVGATSITLSVAPSSSLKVADFLSIGAGTTSCETRRVTAIAGAAVTLASALNIAHAAGDSTVVCPVIIPLNWYGAQGGAGASIDNEIALQAACDDWQYHQQILDGNALIYYIKAPLVQSAEMRLCNALFYAMATYGPLDNNGAMGQMADAAASAYQTVTVTASDDLFTTSASHGMSVNAAVMFKATSMPGGVTYGRRYYVKTVPTATTFTVSATLAGATLNVTSNGTCRAYRNLQALLRWYLDNVRFNGSSVAPVGIRAKVQQQSECKKVRVESCIYKGAVIGGQDGSWWNTEIINCPTLLEITQAEEGDEATNPGSNYQRFYQLNLEGTYDTGLVAYGANTVVHDLHAEGGNSACTVVENHAETLVFSGDTYMNVTGAPAKTMFKLIAGDIVAENINVVSAGGSDATILLDDQVLGDQVLLSDMTGSDHTAAIRLLDSGFKPSIGTGANYQYLIRGGAGRYLKFGGNNVASHTIESHPLSSGQTGRQFRWLDSSGSETTAVGADGKLYIANAPTISGGSGSPEGVVTAPIGSIYLRTDGGTNTTEYRKESGSGNTGWIAASNSAVAPPDGRQDQLNSVLGYTGATWPLAASPAKTAMVTQTVYYTPVYLRAGDLVTNIVICVTTAATASTAARVGLYDKNGNLVASCANDTALFNVSGPKVKALSAAYTVVNADAYYIAQWMDSSSMATIVSSQNASNWSTAVSGKPRPASTQTAQTDLPNPATFGSAAFTLWAGWS